MEVIGIVKHMSNPMSYHPITVPTRSFVLQSSSEPNRASSNQSVFQSGVIPGVLFGLAGIVAILFFLTPIIRAVFSFLPSSWRASLPQIRVAKFFESRERKILRRAVKALEEFRSRGDENYLRPSADGELRSVFLLERIKGGGELFEEIHDHHLSALETLMIMARKRGSSLRALPELEELLSARVALLRAYEETSSSKREVRSKKKKGAEWALDAFDKKLTELGERIDANQSAVIRRLDEIFKELAASSPSDDYQVH